MSKKIGEEIIETVAGGPVEETFIATDKLEAELLNLPALIKGCEKNVYEKQGDISETERIIDIRKNRLIVDIAQEKDAESGKARYPNKEARDAELSNRTQKDDFKEMQKKLTSLYDVLQEEKIQLKFYDNRLGALKAIVRLKGAQE